jgi:type VII secretion EssC-like protein
MNADRGSLAQLALPLITIIGYILVSGAGGRGGGGILFVLPMALSIVASAALAFYTFRRNRKIDLEKQAAYARKLFEMRNDMVASHDKQRYFYLYNHPDPDEAIRLAGGRDGGPDTRLWERRTSDKDFGTIRIGIGSKPSTVIYKASGGQNADAEQLEEVNKLAADSRIVTDIPITIPLRNHYKDEGMAKKGGGELEIVACHAIGIAGQESARVRDTVRAMLVQLAAFHAPTDSRIYVVGAPDAKSSWDWARWLPHCNTSRNESSTGDQLRFEQRKVRRLWDELQSELERRALRLADDGGGDVTIPFLLVVVDALTAKPGESPVKEVEAEAAVSLLLQRGPELGAAIIFLVPDRSHVPSECKSVIEIESVEETLAFRYAEVGVNTTRYDGAADVVDARIAEEDFARRLAPMAVRTTYGADLALAISLLELNSVDTVDKLPILDNWRESRKPEKADWLSVAVGLLAGNKTRELTFSADGDGVHGLAAGTTGSGKSELLLSIIVGLAIRYDPSIVNFVLVDYKGGAAFEPFRTLPHCVDIVTNLQGMAGARTFIALRAELNRRSKILADANVKHIVHYRSRNLHMTKEPFPHLFVIIDEFAEMIKEMPEFKAQLDSIARLGRALGVHLILATQRPSGVVSDQIRANMKFRICLRVETPEDSRELLRRSDAAFLPPNIPGRAYLQVGNENVELMQVARAGGPYTGPQVDSQPPVIWMTRQEQSGAPQVNVSRSEGEAAALSDVIVEIAARLADENDDVKPQKKPWPDPLPERFSLDTEYLKGERNKLLPLNPVMVEWLEGDGGWREKLDWTEHAMRTNIGLIDNPARAEQLTMTVDLTRGHAVLVGASGWGKTTFLRTLITGLASTHSPDELNIYILDFGGRGLDVLTTLPHVGASITSSEEERVQRLLRKLTNMLEERREILSQARADNLLVYNADHPDNIIPAVLVVVDNFAEFKENFEPLLEILIGLVRDGRAYGIHFCVTGEQTNAVPNKIFSLFTERMTLKLADAGEYSNIVGRGVPGIDEVAGRGFVAIDRTPLQFQVALPVAVTPAEEAAGLDDTKKLGQLAEKMNNAWRGARPEGVDILRTIIPLKDILPQTAPEKIQTIIGLEDLDLKPSMLDLQLKGPHFIVIGPPLSGKTTALRTWIVALTNLYPPDRVGVVLIDFQQRLFKYGGAHTLADLPHVLAAVSEEPQLNAVVADLQGEYNRVLKPGQHRPEIFVIADNYDDFASVIPAGYGSKSTAYKDLGDLARKFGPEGLHFVLGGSLSILRTNDDLMRQVVAPRYGLGLDASDAPSALGGRVKAGGSELPPGRGFIVKSGRTSMIQVATPQSDNTMEESLDRWVEYIIDKYPERALWSKDRYPLPVEEPVEPPSETVSEPDKQPAK